MSHDPSPRSVLDHQSMSPAAGRQRLRRALILIVTGFVGILIGSYISAELFYLHYPEEPRSVSSVNSNAIAGLFSSPITMSLGVLPTLRFCGPHGFLVIPGALMAIVGAIAYLIRGQAWALIVVLVGFALWAHNNYLAFVALMSV